MVCSILVVCMHKPVVAQDTVVFLLVVVDRHTTNEMYVLCYAACSLVLAVVECRCVGDARCDVHAVGLCVLVDNPTDGISGMSVWM